MKFRPLIILVVVVASTLAISAQRRDFLTDEEVEMVRDAQQIDRRINVLIFAMDRRFGVLGIDVGSVAPNKKDKDKWGPLPLGTRLEILADIKQIMDKAVSDIDNLAERPDSALIDEPEAGKKPTSFKVIFPAAVRSLAAAAERYRPILAKELAATKVRAEEALLIDIADNCEQIIAAVHKLP